MYALEDTKFESILPSCVCRRLLADKNGVLYCAGDKHVEIGSGEWQLLENVDGSQLAQSDSFCAAYAMGGSLICRRCLSSNALQSFHTPHGLIKFNLAKNVVGQAQSRGDRPYQEDTFAIQNIHLPQSNLAYDISAAKSLAHGRSWATAVSNGKGKGRAIEDSEQVAYLAVFDGHGGTQVSHHLQDQMHAVIESAKLSDAPKTVEDYVQLGGYLRRYKGGPLAPLIEQIHDGNQNLDWGLSARLTLAFLQEDLELISKFDKVGSVGTVCLLHSVTEPITSPYPFFSAPLLSITTAHLGDTRALLCSAGSGRSVPLTETHHPDSRVETDRLMRTGTGAITDSFGESRWGGTLANTRAFGDARFKKLGVFAEPDVNTKVIKADEWSFLILMSDGVTSVMSDQEAVDLCRGHKDPTKAAQAVVNFAEQVGADDNITVLVAPLLGWQKITGPDSSAARREYRLRQASGGSGRQRRM